MLSSTWFRPQSNPRAAAALLSASVTVALLALSPIPTAVAAPAILVTGTALAIGSSLPLFLHLYVRSLLHRPEPRQWRWGVFLAAASLLFLAALDGAADQTLAVGAISIHGFYAAGKLGCAKFGCCQAVPYRVVNATVSLPAFETVTAIVIFAYCALFSMLGDYRMAIASGFTCHCVTRAISYWARGTNVSLQHPFRTPDVFALGVLVLTSASNIT